MNSAYGKKLHPLHVVVTVGTIVFGSILVFGFTNTASGVGPRCTNTCQDSWHESNGQTKYCSPDDKTVRTVHPRYLELKKKEPKTEKDIAQLKVFKAILGKCADDKLNNCKGRSFLPNLTRGSCDKDPGKGLPKGTGEKPKEEKVGEEKGGEGKPPEGNIPEPKPKPPKPPEEKKNDDCLMAQTIEEREACEKKKKDGILSRIPGFDYVKDFFTDETPKEQKVPDLSETAKKILDGAAEKEPPITGENREPANKPPPSVPKEERGTTAGKNPLDQKTPIQGHSRGGKVVSKAATTGFTQPQSQRAQIQSLWRRFLARFFGL